MHPKPFTGPIGRQWHSGYPWLSKKQQGGGPPAMVPRLHLGDFMPSTVTSNFWVIRQQKIMALAQVLQACAKESGFPAGVLCVSAQELQKCMAPLLAFSGDGIVEASF